MTKQITSDISLCMKGGIYTVEKCPVCGQKFEKMPNGLSCPEHLTTPHRYFIQIYSRELKKYIQVYSDSRGNPFSSFEMTERILTRMRSEIDSGSFDPSRYVSQKLKPLRFSNWSSNWLQKARVRTEKGLLSPSYLKELRRYILIYQDFFKDVDIRDVNSKMINEFYLSLRGSPKTVKNVLASLRKMLSDAVAWEDIARVPIFPKIEVPEPEFKTIDLTIQDAIVASVKDQMDRAFLLFTAREMIRPSETRALFWDDLDFLHGRVMIRRHFSLDELRTTTKTKSIKVLPLDAEVRASLARLPRHISSPFVFQKEGKPYLENYARKLWKRITRAMGIEISFYQGTRHSSATEAASRVGLDRVQEFLGHTGRATTKRYARMDVEGLKPVLRPAKEIQ